VDTLSAELIQSGLDTSFVGRDLFFLPETGSTNDEANRLARAGAPEGTVVIADHQTAGRGRLDRQWLSPAGSSLLLSLVFRPSLAPDRVQRLTMIVGLAVVDAIRLETGLGVALKWPNDIVCRRAKLGGILTEIALTGDAVDFVVVGLGLNVNLDPTELPADLLMPATSLSFELGLSVARLPLLRTFLRVVEQRYLAAVAGHLPHEEWAERLVTLGHTVTVATVGDVLTGVAESVDTDGALLVRRPDGHLERVVAGDVTLKRGTLEDE
jgi:BirA family biotin operon repressor/biotin-[acetyl-CoA-carboxylase] ligase